MLNSQPTLDPDNDNAAQDELEQQIVAALKQIFDPEIPVNIYDLGLIYALEVEPAGDVSIQMTLTAPGCPVAQTFPQTVQERIAEVPGVKDVKVELTWEPPWTQDRMTEGAKLQLGML
jgi:FeS assembly SUF system protein